MIFPTSIKLVLLWKLLSIFSTAFVLPDRLSLNHICSRATSSGVYLKILPLGASITYGVGSTDGNGYRLQLRDLLIADEVNVTYVGTQSNGTMVNNLNEGYPGRRISEVGDLAKSSGAYSFLPNLVLIHVGTNDCIQNYDTANAPSRLVDLIRGVLDAVPNTTVVVSNLVPNRDSNVEQCIQTFNSQAEGEIYNLTAEGFKVAFVDMHSAVPISDINESDGTHPTDEGYKKMAQVWYNGIINTGSSISPPNKKRSPALI